jgi:hypothetical protein
MIEKQITIEGVMRYDEEQSNETAVPISYRVEAITKPGTYTVVENLDHDFGILYVKVRVTEAFDGTWSLGTDAAPNKFIGSAACKKTVGRKYYNQSDLTNKGADMGETIKLFMGAGTTGKIEVHVTGFLLKPSLL